MKRNLQGSGDKAIIPQDNLLELIDLQFLQNLQDFFATTMNVASLTVDKNGPVTQPSNFSDLCLKHTRGSELGCKRCTECDIKYGELAAKKGEPVIYTCHAGLTDFAVPIMVGDQHLATILGGQILTKMPNEDLFRQTARELNLNEEEYIEQLNKIKVIPLEKIEAAAQFLFLLTNSLSCIARANLKLSEFGLDYKLSKSVKMEEFFACNSGGSENSLSLREFEVLKLIVLGKNNTEIAKDLFISVHTAKKHVSSILQKMFVNDRVQIAVKAVRERII